MNYPGDGHIKSDTGVNKAYAEVEATKNSRKPIHVPVVPPEAALPQKDLTEEIEENNEALKRNTEALLKCKEDQIAQLTAIVELQKKCIDAQDEQIKTLQAHFQNFPGGRMD